MIPATPLTPLEIAGGLITGGTRLALPTSGPADPTVALIEAVRPAIERGGPLLVSFSGGMDSSLVLAAAVRAARAAGAPLPIPITWRADDAPGAVETDWQEAVVAELGISDWIRLPAGDDLDWIGPVALDVIARIGLTAPPNVHLHDPLLAHARGGTLLTGAGGDQLLMGWRWRLAADVLAGRAPRRPRGAVRVLAASLPAPVRAARERRRAELSSPWLVPSAAAAVARAHAAETINEPLDWRARTAWIAGRRWLSLGTAALDQLAQHHGARIAHPLIDPLVLAAVARSGGRHGFGTRAQGLEAAFGALLPRALRTRRGKAHFDGVLTREASRDLIARWDGTGLGALVDPQGLQEIWREGVPMRTALLLQQLATGEHGTKRESRSAPEGT